MLAGVRMAKSNLKDLFRQTYHKEFLLLKEYKYIKEKCIQFLGRYNAIFYDENRGNSQFLLEEFNL